MRSHHPQLVRFEFQHEYYQSVQSAFTFQPQRQTQRLLRRFGLLYRSTRDGFTILYQAIKDETETLVPLRNLPEQFALRFWICTKYPTTGTVSASGAPRGSKTRTRAFVNGDNAASMDKLARHLGLRLVRDRS